MNQNASPYEDIPAGICKTLCDDDLTILFANEAYYGIFGYTRAEALTAGFTNVRFIVPEDAFPSVRETAVQSIANGVLSYSVECQEKTKSGEMIWVIANTRVNPNTNTMVNYLVDITARKKMEEQLLLSDQEYRVAAQQSGKYIFHYDIQAKRLEPRFDAKALWGHSDPLENIPDSFIFSRDLAPESRKEYSAFYSAIRNGEAAGTMIFQMRTADGLFHWFRSDFSTIYDADGKAKYAVISMYDVTDEREKSMAYERFRQEEDTLPLHSIMQYEVNVSKGICERERGERLPKSLTEGSNNYSEIFNHIRKNVILHEDRGKFLELFARENLVTLFSSGKRKLEADFRLMHEKDSASWIHVRVQMVPDPYSYDIKAFITFEDIDGQKQEELRLKYLSTIDPLTGVLNRNTFEKQVSELIENSLSVDQHAFIIIDIDHFKQVNDKFGHLKGDQVLREISSGLTSLIREGDLLGRLGGDEFVLLLKNIPLDDVIEKRVSLICQLLHTNRADEPEISVSLGISLWPRDGSTFKPLYSKADIALYEAKNRGRNTYVFYSTDLGSFVTTSATPIDDVQLSLNSDAEYMRRFEKIRKINQALIARQNEDERYSILLGNSGAIVLDWNIESNSTYASANFRDYVLFQDSVQDFFCKNYSLEAIYADDIEMLNKNLFDVLDNGGSSAETAFRLKKTDGSYVWVRITMIYLRNNNGTLKRALCMFNEINFVREKADIQLEALFKTIEDGIAIIECGQEINAIFLNPGFFRLLGVEQSNKASYSQEEIFSGLAQDEKEDLLWGLRKAAADQSEFDMVYRIERQDGRMLWHHMHAVRIPYEDSYYPVLLATLNDVTALKEGEEKARFAVSQFHTLINNIPGALVLIEVRKDCLYQLYSSLGSHKLFGFTQDEFRQQVDENLSYLVHHEDRPGLYAAFSQAAMDDQAFEYSFRTIHTREKKWILLHAVLLHYQKGLLEIFSSYEDKSQIREPSGRYPVFLVTLTDLSAEKEMEQQLQASSQRHQAAFDLTSANLWEYDVNTQVGTLSQTLLDNSLFRSEHVQNLCETAIEQGIVHPDSAKSFRYLFSQIHNGIASGSCKAKLKKPDGIYTWTRVSFKNLFDDNQRPVTAVGFNEYLGSEAVSASWFEQELLISQTIREDVLYKGRVNISKNEIEWIERFSERVAIDLENVKTLDDLLKLGSDAIPDNAQYWLNTMRFSQNSLMHSFDSGTDLLFSNFQVVEKSGKILWCGLGLSMGIEPKSGDLYAFFSVRDVDKKKKAELSLPERVEYEPVCGFYALSTFKRLFSMYTAEATSENFCALIILEIRNYAFLEEQLGSSTITVLLKDIGLIIASYCKTVDIVNYEGNGRFLLFIPAFSAVDEFVQIMEQKLADFYSGMALTGIRGSAQYSVGSDIEPCRSAIFEDMYEKALSASERNWQQSKDIVTVFSESTMIEEIASEFRRAGISDYQGQNTFAACVAALDNSAEGSDSIVKVLSLIGAYYKADRVYIGKYDATTGLSSNTYSWTSDGVPSIQNEVDGYNLEEASPNMVKMIMGKKEKLYIEDINSDQTEPRQRELMQKFGINLMYMIPFAIDRKPYGFFGIDDPHDHLGDWTLMDALSFMIANEISRSRLLNKESFLDWHDDMTGLLNRRSYIRFTEKFNPDSVSSIGVLSLDINGLKDLNQQYGHLYGDSLIKHTGAVLQHWFGKDNVYRIAGDELVVMVKDVSKDKFQKCVDGIKPDLDKVRADLVSIGHTWTDVDFHLADLLIHTEELLSLEKEAYYHRTSSSTHSARSEMTDNLIKSIANGEFHMYLQPKADIKTGEIVGAEALMRFMNSQYGMVAPDRIIPMLEKERIVHYVDLFMFDSVVKTLQDWKDRGLRLIPISLNFSRATILYPNLLSNMEEIMKNHDISRDLVEIEITETLGDMEQDTIMRISDQLISAGYRLSLDDFGARYSNLSILTMIGFNMLKLDKSLTNSLSHNEKTQIIVSRVIELCKDLSTRIIAEGVETEEQRSVLSGLGCQYIQGYLINKAIPADDFENLYII